MADPSLLESVHRDVAERSPFADGTVEGVTVGDRLVLVELAGEAGTAAGVAHRPPGDVDADPAGVPAVDVAAWAVESDGEALLRRAVGVAALNALSDGLVDWRTGDPFEALAADVTAIATVGLFGPAFRKFGAVDVRVVERREVSVPGTPEGVTVSLFSPDEAATAMDGADVAFVTGSTLLYGGTERYLTAARDAGVGDVVLVGATASFVPAPAFAAGATMLAGGRVTDAAGIRGRIRGGECATDLHGEGLAKVYATAGGTAALEFG